MALDQGRGQSQDTSAAGLYAIETWGCQMNVHDSEKMAGALGRLGYRPTTELRDADVILLNTCAIREKASHKVYTRLGRLRRLKLRNPDLLIGVAGCVAQLEGEAIFQRAPYVDLVLGPRGLSALPELLDKARRRRSSHLEPMEDSLTYPFETAVRAHQVKAYVTVMEGCDKRCTFCVVPATRGKEEYRPLAHVLQEIAFLVEKGYREVELLGQNVNTYRAGDTDFAGLLRAVNAVDGLERIRFTTSHPLHFVDDIIDAMAESSRVCPSIHLPVQSGSDRILRLMRRGYTRERFLDRVHRIRETIPGCTLSTDIIVGFPGEESSDFTETMSLVEEVRFERAFSFLFSPRPGTPAEHLPLGSSLKERQARLATLQNRQQEIQEEVHAALVGRQVAVLVEGTARTGEGVYVGRTAGNHLVHFPGHDGMVGRTLPIALDSCTPNALYGSVQPEFAAAQALCLDLPPGGAYK
jgi:tRNA-2-methylthio-N6-dimethylallyladenosine synthase